MCSCFPSPTKKTFVLHRGKSVVHLVNPTTPFPHRNPSGLHTLSSLSHGALSPPAAPSLSLPPLPRPPSLPLHLRSLSASAPSLSSARDPPYPRRPSSLPTRGGAHPPSPTLIMLVSHSGSLSLPCTHVGQKTQYDPMEEGWPQPCLWFGDEGWRPPQVPSGDCDLRDNDNLDE